MKYILSLIPTLALLGASLFATTGLLGGGPTLTVTGGEPGGYMHITVSGLATGSEFVLVLSSLGPGPTATPFGDIAVTAPFRLTPRFQEVAGSFNWTSTVPLGAAGATFYMQVVEFEAGGGTTTSNPATISVE
ncbi:MAG: hypothetical protein COA70_09070 [Planctomycetota bacterium]|nr:MAG: hypothetical protein COA70_09070 [Planctomycetota bacterium]